MKKSLLRSYDLLYRYTSLSTPRLSTMANSPGDAELVASVIKEMGFSPAAVDVGTRKPFVFACGFGGELLSIKREKENIGCASMRVGFGSLGLVYTFNADRYIDITSDFP